MFCITISIQRTLLKSVLLVDEPRPAGVDEVSFLSDGDVMVFEWLGTLTLFLFTSVITTLVIETTADH